MPDRGDDRDVARDDRVDYYLQTKKPAYKKGPLMFAAVRVGKAYVSFHLLPIYMNESLKATISPALRNGKFASRLIASNSARPKSSSISASTSAPSRRD